MYTVQRQAVVNTVMNLLVSYNTQNGFSRWATVIFSTRTLLTAVSEGIASCVLACYRIIFIRLKMLRGKDQNVSWAVRDTLFIWFIMAGVCQYGWIDCTYYWKSLLFSFFLVAVSLVLCVGWNDLWICLAEYPFSQRVIMRWATSLCRLASSEMFFASCINVDRMPHFWCKAAFSS
jgi:hypothetical protein